MVDGQEKIIKQGYHMCAVSHAEKRPADLVLLESVVQQVTGRSVEDIRRQPLDEERRQVEARTGKRMRFTRNFPFIGRGCIMGDRAKSSEEIDRMLDEALK